MTAPRPTPPQSSPGRSSSAGERSPSAAGSHRGPVQWFLRGGWYLPVILLSLGILSFVPFVHAALRTRRQLHRLAAVLYTAAVITVFLIPTSAAGGGILIGLMIIAFIHAVVLRRQVWAHPRAADVEPARPDPAVAVVLAARARRVEARRMAAADPLLARELRIGRPDLGPEYDDGGLVDLGGAPPAAMAAVCGIDLALAERIVEVRAAGILIASVDDVLLAADIPYPLWDRIRDRGVVVTG